ncbi:30S ribosomal protein S4 [Holospora obtusa F1]|uniref:Small ribosomal subunit protein uS4 n=1 Tax=Holospora obtusa F1 TaxID=1399147 RepID=W6TDV9_HOLOB|nr:30S ribosomal protein S4 [Holospora obtusa]ETZ06986.1 30S ribosomal protein S4 [Holospora obtusa F1]
MTKIINSKHKAERRYGIFWEGIRTSASSRAYPAGQHGAKTFGKSTVYGQQMKVKQRLKKHYGRISEKQFYRTYLQATSVKGDIGSVFLQFLEQRLGSCVYRLKFSPTIFSACQLVSHGHIFVNGARVDVSSYRVKVGDVISLDPSMHSNVVVQRGQSSVRRVPEYFKIEGDNFSAKLSYAPDPAQIPYPFDHQVSSVIEFYAR